MNPTHAYIAHDQRQALALNIPLPPCAPGAILSADIAGFTLLTEKLATRLGLRQGAEAIAQILNQSYDRLIATVETFGGSVVSFSGDAMRCWFADDDGRRAIACGLAMLNDIAQLPPDPRQAAESGALGVKIAVVSGEVQRFRLGDPDIQYLDTLAGDALSQLAAIEGHVQSGELIVDQPTAVRLAAIVRVAAWRELADTPLRGAIVTALDAAIDPRRSPPADTAIAAELVRPWVLPVVWTRLERGQGEFLTELRPAVALFAQFGDLAAQTLESFICWVQAVIAGYAGIVLQVTLGEKGNYIYAAFGAPTAHEDDAARAIHAARQLIDPPAPWSQAGPIRIGVSQGLMRTGAYGSATRRTYGVLGDAVNVAARLMQHAAPQQILASAAVYEATAALFDWQFLPALRAKGKTAPIPIAALQPGQPARPGGRTEPAYRLPLIGRIEELDHLRTQLAGTQTGHGRIMTISGEAGIGKSRLVAVLAQIAQEQGFRVFQGACQSYATTTPYLVWQSIWRAIFGLESSDTPSQQISRLEQAVAPVNPLFVARVPLLGPIVNLDIPDTDLTQTFDPALRNSSREALLVDYFRVYARDQAERGTRLLIILEDMHWSDPLSHRLVQALAATIGQLPVLLAWVSRAPHGFAPPTGGAEAAAAITLQALEPASAQDLVAAKLEQLGMTLRQADLAQLTEMILTRTQGNPFFIEELVNYLHAQRYDLTDMAVWQASDLPTSLHRLILSRIDQLSARQQETVKIASVIGRLFQVAWLHGCYPMLGDYSLVSADLAAIAATDLALLAHPEPELAYMFKHIITQEVAYESLASTTRRTLHERVAAYLEPSGETPPPERLYLLAYHYERSENVAKQREYLGRAGSAAQAAYANTAAIAYYERLLAILDEQERYTAYLNLGMVLELVGDWDRAETMYQEALRLATAAADTSRQMTATMALGVMNRKRGSYDQGIALFTQARALAEACGDAAKISQIIAEIGFILGRKGQYGEARAILEEGIDGASGHTDRAALALIYHVLGLVLLHMGNIDDAKTVTIKSLDLRSALGLKHEIAKSLNNLAICYSYLGDTDHMHALWHQSLALYREIGDKLGQSDTLHNLGANKGWDLEAIGFLKESLAIRREMDNLQGIAISLTALGSAYIDGNAYEDAALALYESLAIYRRLNEASGIILCLINLYGMFAEMGRNHKRTAYALLRISMIKSKKARFKLGVIVALNEFGLVFLKRQRLRKSQEYYDRALRTALKATNRRYVVRTIAELATVSIGLELRQGQDDERLRRLVAIAAANEGFRDAAKWQLEPRFAAIYAAMLASARASLGDSVFDAAWRDNSGQSLEALASDLLALAHRRTWRPRRRPAE